MKNREIRSALFGMFLVLGMFASLTASSRGALVKATTDDPIAASRFAIVIDGVEIAQFAELAGISSGYDIDDMSLTSRRLKLPDSRTPPTVILRRGHTSDTTVWDWHLAALVNATAARKTAALVIYDAEGKPVARYHLENAWPSKVEIGALKAGASEVLMETVTIVCEQLQRVAV